MEDSAFPLRLMIGSIIFALVIILAIFFWKISDTYTTVVFCNVGQGDAAYIRIKNKIDMVVDGGPDDSVLRCLGKYMPFYDHTIELAFITHPQKDHYYGFIDILDRYTVKKIFMNQLDSSNESFSLLKNKLVKNGTQIFFPKAGTTITESNSYIRFFWPDSQFLADNLNNYQSHFIYNYPIQKGQNLNFSDMLTTSTVDPNFVSLIFTYHENSIKILFTGDIPAEVLNKLLDVSGLKTTILKVPHHGSKTGLNEAFLQLADPVISVISVGRNNRYGHPSPEVLNLLNRLKKKYLRTDKEGDVVFKIREDMLERL